MYCPECGQKNDDSNKVCCNCGAPLIDNSNDLGSISTFDFDKLKSDFGKVTDAIKKLIPPKEKILSNKKLLIPIGAAAAVVLCLIILLSIAKSACSPEKVALDYFDAYASGQYEKMFSYLSVDTSADAAGINLITSDTFAAYMRDGNSMFENVQVLNRELQKGTYGTEYYGEYESDLQKAYSVNYVSSTYGGNGYLNINLINTGKKKYLFFNEYKVVLDYLPIVRNVTLNVPNDASVWVDNSQLTEYVSKETYNIYTISQMLGYTHDITLDGDSVEKETKEYTFKDNDENSLQYTINGNLKSALNSKIQATMKAFISGAAIQKPFSELGLADSLSEAYSNEKSYFSNEKIKSATVTEVDIDDEISWSEYGSTLDVDVHFSYTQEQTSSWTGKTETINSTGYLAYALEIYYDAESGSWEINDIYND